ncbi:MAG: tetratricopeptide repeat protein [Deltaproteobacteria bacterium]|nr:tetratricopeptide repeat protein [Deltaproteobacteria bacterium]MBN2670548.1 tetratricopeptide repeat protein [Deltaproteobacteria bacterium]
MKITLLSVCLLIVGAGRNASADSLENGSGTEGGVAEEAASADSDVSAQAKAAFAEATDLYVNGKYEEAAQKFNEAYRLKPAWKLLYNIGQAEAASKRLGLAIEAFEKYLTEGGDEIPVDRRDEVLKEVERLRQIVGAVDLKAPDGYGVYVDGVARGITPLLGKMRISASKEHVIELRDGDIALDSKTVLVAGQEVIVVTLGSGLAAKTSTSVGSAVVTTHQLSPEQMNERQRRKLLRQSKVFKIVGWSALGVGGGLVLISLVGLGESKSQKEKNDEAFDDCAGNQTCETEVEKDIADQEMLRDGSIGLLVLGAAAMIASPFILKASKKKKRRAEALQTAVVPVLSPHFGGVSISASF